jgi:hypothetical protein
MIRYLIMLSVHKYKIRFIQKLKNISLDSVEKSEKLQQILMRFLKLFSSQYSYLILPPLWGVIYTLIVLTIYGVNEFECTNATAFQFRLSYTIGLFFFASLIAFTILIDFILNLWNFIKCRWKQYFFDDDPYHYRLDMILCAPTVPIVLIWVFVPMPLYIRSLLIEALVIIGFWIGIGQTLTITIFKYFYYKFKQRNAEKMLSLDNIFSNEDLSILFLEFAKTEWSSENVYFRIDVEKYLKSPQSERNKICKKIKSQYLNFSKSPLEINATENQIKSAVTKMNDNQFDDDLFDVLMNTVNLNLSDTIC